jgi:hypothetical protein
MSDLLSAASLLMTVIAILYSLWYPELTRTLEIKPAKYKEDNVGPMKQVQNIWLAKALPLSIMALIVTLVFMPDAIRICFESYNEWSSKGNTAISYDAVRTAYVVVFIFSLILASYVIMISLKIWNLRGDLRK